MLGVVSRNADRLVNNWKLTRILSFCHLDSALHVTYGVDIFVNLYPITRPDNEL